MARGIVAFVNKLPFIDKRFSKQTHFRVVCAKNAQQKIANNCHELLKKDIDGTIMYIHIIEFQCRKEICFRTPFFNCNFPCLAE